MGVPPGSRVVWTLRPNARSRPASNEIWVVFPLPSVPSKVMNRPPAISRGFQFRPFRGVFHNPAFGFQFVANGVGALEVFGGARRLTGNKQGVDLVRNF